MRYTIDQTHIRAYNQRIILDQIYQSDTVSRADLSRKVHISKSAMTENIASLIRMGLIEEVGQGKSMPLGGRKPILLRFNKNYCYTIAIELNFEDPIFVLANLGGEIINRLSFPLSGADSFSERLELVNNAINTLMLSKQLTKEDIRLIAISTPGVYDAENEENYRISSQFVNWKIPELKKNLESNYDVDVFVVNDVNAAAYGEYNYGLKKGAKNVLYLSCGMGLGSGLIINGQLYEGSSKAAGEIAFWHIMETDRRDDNLESLLNIPYLLEYFDKNAPAKSKKKLQQFSRSTNSPAFKDIVQLWQSGDPFMHACIEDISQIIARVVCNIITLLNCDYAVLGGEYLVFYAQMLPIIFDYVQNHAFFPVPVIASHLGNEAGVHGLLSLSRSKILDQLCNISLQNYGTD